MTSTVAQLIAQTREAADAVGSSRWSDTTIQAWIGLEQWRWQAKLLNANNQYYINGGDGTLIVTEDANGQFDVANFSTGTGDTKRYFYRVQTLGQPSGGGQAGTSGPLYYKEASYIRYPNPQPSTSLPYVWYKIGTKIQVLPAIAGQSLTAVVNYRPPRADQLSATSVTLDYPDGYESGLAFAAAAKMLQKGDAQGADAAALQAIADSIGNDMLLDLGRSSTQPIIALASDNPEDWGSSVP